MRYAYEDTIVAPASGNGGAIVCIRVSGNAAIEIVSNIFVTWKRNFGETPSGMMRLGKIMNGDEQLDEAMAVIFRSPTSYTGEDVVELTCHGSAYIVRTTITLLVERGCRLAVAGEFTQRAFMNGKMDLSQAEAVADLIAATSAAAHRIAIKQMRGEFSMTLDKLHAELLDFVSLIELELDFADEDLVFADRATLAKLVNNILETINRLIDSFDAGNAIKNGIPVVIVGETNTGKSTLLNLLLHDEKAIVSDIHGTTRDVIEDTVILQGVMFRFIDTAGIRETQDVIETIGIERTFRKIDEANIILWTVDIRSDESHIEQLAETLIPLTSNKTLILVFNKIDCASDDDMARATDLLSDRVTDRLFISALCKTNIDRLEAAIIEASGLDRANSLDVIVTNVRHFEALNNARQSLLRVESGLVDNISTDFLTQDIRECMRFLGEITGEISTDEILGNIFSKFCIGK
jgi:tRNA modification GTPase